MKVSGDKTFVAILATASLAFAGSGGGGNDNDKDKAKAKAARARAAAEKPILPLSATDDAVSVSWIRNVGTVFQANGASVTLSTHGDAHYRYAAPAVGASQATWAVRYLDTDVEAEINEDVSAYVSLRWQDGAHIGRFYVDWSTGFGDINARIGKQALPLGVESRYSYHNYVGGNTSLVGQTYNNQNGATGVLLSKSLADGKLGAALGVFNDDPAISGASGVNQNADNELNVGASVHYDILGSGMASADTEIEMNSDGDAVSVGVDYWNHNNRLGGVDINTETAAIFLAGRNGPLQWFAEMQTRTDENDASSAESDHEGYTLSVNHVLPGPDNDGAGYAYGLRYSVHENSDPASILLAGAQGETTQLSLRGVRTTGYGFDQYVEWSRQNNDPTGGGGSHAISFELGMRIRF